MQLSLCIAQRAGLESFSAWGGLSSVKPIHVGLSVLTRTCKSAKEANVHVFSKENQIKMILSKTKSAGGNTLGIGFWGSKEN